MKLLKLATSLLITAALCGCSSTGLGDKVIVKALLLDYQKEYLAQVLVLEPQPSADAGEVAETIRLIEGSGSTLAEAIHDVESARAEELFYGQNELLLLGPGLQQTGIAECCRFLYENSAGRPNMAVWGINRPANEQPFNEENAGPVLDSIRRLGERGNTAPICISSRQHRMAFFCRWCICPKKTMCRWRGSLCTKTAFWQPDLPEAKLSWPPCSAGKPVPGSFRYKGKAARLP